MDWQRWLDRVTEIEKASPDKRVVAVQIPGGLPDIAWNVENNQYKWNSIVGGPYLDNLRKGIYGTFLVTDGPFVVRFNTGETAK